MGRHLQGPRRDQYTFEEPLPALPQGSSKEEQMVARELNRRRIEWEAQVSYAGGRSVSGGMVVDFVLPAYRSVIRVQGVHWHAETGERDIQQKLTLLAQGYRVIDLTDVEIDQDVAGALDRELGMPL